MINKPYIMLLFFVLYLSGSCNKDTWNESAKINVVSESNEGNQSHIDGNTYLFNSGELKISKLILIGERIQAEDISIETKTTFNINLKSGELSEKVNLNLPQGTYNSLKYHLILSNNSLKLNYSIADNNPFIDNKILIFDLNLNDLIGDVLDADEEKEILIVSDKKYDLVINLNWDSLLEDINQGLINSAISETINGVDHIIVNNNTNNDLFSIIESNIQNSIKLSIK